MSCIYNSRDEQYKSPFGALRAGQPVRFALRVPRGYGCTAPCLFLRPDGGEAARLALQPAGHTEEEDLFELTHAVDAPGLYFYWFDLWVDYRKLYRGPGGRAEESTGEGPLWQLTVYDAAYKTPASVHSGVMYQIFPDRFYEGDPAKPLSYNERIYRHDKDGEPYFWPTNQEAGYLTRDYFGGDLLGIEKKLPYLRELGVNWVYLNPIFEAHANHRYNTADYLNVDPYLGTNEDFERLCRAAKKAGISIILDGVFSHTGSDSLYFNKEARYPTLGAWQSPQSPYRPWYRFHDDGSYDSWWGFDTLPACDKQNPAFRQFIAGEGGVVDTWLRRGAAGFRLDVADELPDDFIAEIRAAVKRRGEDKLLIGEVWEDATTKEAYGVRRRYFWGAELDGVMNYPFRTAILDYLHGFGAEAFCETVMSVCENYPAPALNACTTHLSTHDTIRAITALAGDGVDGHDRYWQSGRRLSAQQYALGIEKMKLALVLQFTLPGVPCVYYGDEVAMQGYADPFNRAFFTWDSKEHALLPLLRQLSHLRRACAAFAHSQVAFTRAERGVLVYRRWGGGAECAVGVNCSDAPVTVRLLGDEVTLPVLGHAWRSGRQE